MSRRPSWGRKVRDARAYRKRAAAAERAGRDGSEFIRYAERLEAELVLAKRCRECGRPLQKPISQQRGYGEDCWAARQARATA